MEQLAAPYERDGVLIVPVTGEFDVGNAPDLERYLSELSAPPAGTVLDLSDTGYLDSSVLAVLIRRKKAQGASVAIVVPKSSKVRMIFDVSGLVEAFSICETLDEAVKNLGEQRLGTA